MKEFLKAHAKFQSEVPIIHKGTKGYNYSYADLAEIVEKISPVLKSCNLGFYQKIDSELVSDQFVEVLRTVIYHTDSGEKLESKVNLDFDKLAYVEIEKIGKDKKTYKSVIIRGFDGMNLPQAQGSLITYFRRYSLSCLLGLVSDMDSDARNKRLDDIDKPLPNLTRKDKKNWGMIVKTVAQENYTIEQCRTKWGITEENEKLLNDDVTKYQLNIPNETKKK